MSELIDVHLTCDSREAFDAIARQLGLLQTIDDGNGSREELVSPNVIAVAKIKTTDGIYDATGEAITPPTWSENFHINLRVERKILRKAERLMRRRAQAKRRAARRAGGKAWDGLELRGVTLHRRIVDGEPRYTAERPQMRVV